MEIEFTVKIKDEHNPPEFSAGMGKGVIAIYTIDFEEKPGLDFKSPIFQVAVLDKVDELLKEHFEVIPKIKE